jgi:hypothetical protein
LGREHRAVTDQYGSNDADTPFHAMPHQLDGLLEA